MTAWTIKRHREAEERGPKNWHDTRRMTSDFLDLLAAYRALVEAVEADQDEGLAHDGVSIEHVRAFRGETDD